VTLCGSVKNSLYMLHLLMLVLSKTVAMVSLSAAPMSRAVSNWHIPGQYPGGTVRAVM